MPIGSRRGRGGRGRAKGKGKGKGKGKFRRRGGGMGRPRVCRFCADKKLTIDYKDAAGLTKFVTERGKIISRRNSGVCARHQRGLCSAIKQARYIALLPYVRK